MQINTNGSFNTYWRVWTGDTTGTVVKRVFVTNAATSVQGNLYTNSSQSGSTAADSICSTQASAASLGGTWKALVSASVGNEPDWAVNRIGYNWSELRLVNGTTVVYAGNLWMTESVSLLNAIVKDATGTNVTTGYVWTGTHPNGLPYALYDSTYTCSSYTSNSGSLSGIAGLMTAANSTWTNNTPANCASSSGRLYCVEQ